MKVTQPYTIDSEVLSRFNKTVPSGERSQVVNDLMEKYVSLRNPDKKALRVQHELEKREAEDRLAKLMSIDKEEGDRALAEQLAREKKLLEEQAKSDRQHFLDDCRRRAKILVNIEFGLDELADLLPKSFSESNRSIYRIRWKELTEKLEKEMV